MPDFSVVTCISDPGVYDRCLLSSVKRCRGQHDVAVVPIINNDGRYSASNALNLGLEVSKSDVVIFAHQDIILLENWFDLLKRLLEQIDDQWAVIGCCGIHAKYSRSDIGPWGGAVGASTVGVGCVWSSDTVTFLPPYWNGTKDLAPIHCADECLFVYNKKAGLKFDRSFNGFHFYGVDLCLQARAKGLGVYGAYLPVVHQGNYSTSYQEDPRYWAYLRLLQRRWSDAFPVLLGTHMHWAPDELTSYIAVRLEDQSGLSVRIKASGIKRAKFIR